MELQRDPLVVASHHQPPTSALNLLVRHQCLVYTLTIFLVETPPTIQFTFCIVSVPFKLFVDPRLIYTLRLWIQIC